MLILAAAHATWSSRLAFSVRARWCKVIRYASSDGTFLLHLANEGLTAAIEVNIVHSSRFLVLPVVSNVKHAKSLEALGSAPGRHPTS